MTCTFTPSHVSDPDFIAFKYTTLYPITRHLPPSDSLALTPTLLQVFCRYAHRSMQSLSRWILLTALGLLPASSVHTAAVSQLSPLKAE